MNKNYKGNGIFEGTDLSKKSVKVMITTDF